MISSFVCLFTEAYANQFAGEKEKKFSTKQLRELLLDIHRFPMSEEKHHLSVTLNDWMGTAEQVDDILLVGIKF